MSLEGQNHQRVNLILQIWIGVSYQSANFICFVKTGTEQCSGNLKAIEQQWLQQRLNLGLVSRWDEEHNGFNFIRQPRCEFSLMCYFIWTITITTMKIGVSVGILWPNRSWKVVQAMLSWQVKESIVNAWFDSKNIARCQLSHFWQASKCMGTDFSVYTVLYWRALCRTLFK